jgi:hypothetical protein
MLDRSTKSIAFFSFIACVLSPVVSAQPEDLYRVEMLVFSQPGGAASEKWDPIPELAYPNSTRFLIYPGERQSEPAGLPMTSTTGGSAIGTQVSASPGLAYETLSPGDRQFSGKAAAMQSSGRYRVLFHEAWIQPMGSQSQALPIVIDRSGDGGPWPELQGTIKLYLSRYFYLETNLWLNTQGEYLSGTWQMPAPPLAPVSAPARNRVQSNTSQVAITASPGQSYSRSVVAETQQMTAPDEALDSGYPYRHAVLLQQTRRMRSGEVAYVDHPLLGVLIKITPLGGTEDSNG